VLVIQLLLYCFGHRCVILMGSLRWNNDFGGKLTRSTSGRKMSFEDVNELPCSCNFNTQIKTPSTGKIWLFQQKHALTMEFVSNITGRSNFHSLYLCHQLFKVKIVLEVMKVQPLEANGIAIRFWFHKCCIFLHLHQNFKLVPASTHPTHSRYQHHISNLCIDAWII
jgi:hypothetical protein